MKLTLKPKELLRALKNAILFIEDGAPDEVHVAIVLDDPPTLHLVGAGPFSMCIDSVPVGEVEDPNDVGSITISNYEELEKFLASVKDLKASPGYVVIDVETSTIIDRASGSSLSLAGSTGGSVLVTQAIELTQGEFEYVNDWRFGFQPGRLARLWRVKSSTPDVPAVFSVLKNPLKDGYIMRIAVGPTCRVVLAGVNLTKTEEYIRDMEIDGRCLHP
jgi:hypothetical protein